MRFSEFLFKKPQYTCTRSILYIISDSLESPIPGFIALLPSPSLYLFHPPPVPFPAECRFNCASLERSGLIVSIWEPGQTKVPRVQHCFLGHRRFLSSYFSHPFFRSVISFHFLLAASLLSSHLFRIPPVSPFSTAFPLFFFFPPTFHYRRVCGSLARSLSTFGSVSPLTPQTFKPSIWHLSLAPFSLSYLFFFFICSLSKLHSVSLKNHLSIFMSRSCSPGHPSVLRRAAYFYLPYHNALKKVTGSVEGAGTRHTITQKHPHADTQRRNSVGSF